MALNGEGIMDIRWGLSDGGSNPQYTSSYVSALAGFTAHWRL
jgi:hypothetical protein